MPFAGREKNRVSPTGRMPSPGRTAGVIFTPAIQVAFELTSTAFRIKITISSSSNNTSLRFLTLFFEDMARMLHLFDVDGYEDKRHRRPRLVRERVHPLELHDDVAIFARYRFGRTNFNMLLTETLR